MSVTLIGGIDRLKQDYIRKARQKGVNLNCILHDVPDLKARIGTPDNVDGLDGVEAPASFATIAGALVYSGETEQSEAHGGLFGFFRRMFK